MKSGDNNILVLIWPEFDFIVVVFVDSDFEYEEGTGEKQ